MLGMFKIKKSLDMVIIAKIGLGKSVLFQGISIAIKNGIVIVILQTFALIIN